MPGRAAGESSGRSPGRRCRRPCGRRSRPGAGSGCGAGSGRRTAPPGRGRSPRRRRSRRPACRRSPSSLWRTTTTADGGVASSVWRSAFARADSRSSRMNPPARRTPDDPRRERHGDEQDDGPDEDDRPAPADRQAAQPGEDVAPVRRSGLGRRGHRDGRVTGQPGTVTSFGGGRHAHPMLYTLPDSGISRAHGDATIDATERATRAMTG